MEILLLTSGSVEVGEYQSSKMSSIPHLAFSVACSAKQSEQNTRLPSFNEDWQSVPFAVSFKKSITK